MEKEKILEINHMKISFCQYQKGMHQTELPVISDLNVTVRAGEMVAIVGSSGSGKSLLAHGILGILPYNASMKGGIQYCGEPLTGKKSGNFVEKKSFWFRRVHLIWFHL